MSNCALAFPGYGGKIELVDFILPLGFPFTKLLALTETGT
jgi:hypothetical protein